MYKANRQQTKPPTSPSTDNNQKRRSRWSSLYLFSLYTLSWLHKVYPCGSGDSKEFEPLISQLSKVFETRGPREGIKYSKALRLSFIYWLTGDNRRVEGVQYGVDGKPKVLQPYLSEDVKRMPRKLAVLLTVLTVSRAVHLPKEPDFRPIETAPQQGNCQSIGKYIKDFWRDLGYHPFQRIPKSLRWTQFHFTSKSGPNGQATWTALSDLIALDQNPELLESIRGLGGEKLSRVMSTLRSLLQYMPPFLLTRNREKLLVRKLEGIPDKEGKTRLVAILDYWSQTALRPLHTFLFRVLKRIPQDKTFAQGAFKDILSKGDGEYYSVDLTAATDRFPITLIEDVLKGLLPTNYVRFWSYIMVGLPFDYQGSLKHYRTGNPMGALSSWSSFAVAHHYVVYYCCRETGVSWKDLSYTLLGDDIVIRNKLVAEMYLRVIKELGVEVSSSKTHVSSEIYEFAKRWIYRGSEITPFPFTSLRESSKRYYSLVNLLIEVEQKEWILRCSIPEAIDSFYNYVMKRPSRFRKSLHDKVIISEAIMKIMAESIPANEGINSLIRQLGFAIPQLTLDECTNILSNIAVELFAESNPENLSKEEKSKLPPLGVLAETTLLLITSPEFEKVSNSLGIDPTLVPPMIPILGLYGQIEESYLELRKKAKRVDTIHAGEWPLLLRSMLLPLSDRVFYTRASELKPYASSLFHPKLKQRFELLQSPMGRRLLGR